jgi:GTP cyclohydrolase I
MTWEEFKDLCKVLAGKVKEYKFDAVYGIPKGGCYVALELSHLLGIPLVGIPQPGCLVVDDLVDSGRTLSNYPSYRTATLFVKPHASDVPTFYLKKVKGWVTFPWEGQCNDTIEDNIIRILEFIGENPNRPGLKDTPKRIVRMYKEIFKGYDPKNRPDLTDFGNEEDGIAYDEIAFDCGSFSSWCEHHMLSFKGFFYFGYLPDKKIVGLSKIARVVDYYSSRLQVQERLGKQIADEFWVSLKPKGLGIMLKGNHLCKEVRGIKNKGPMITSVLRGVFRKDHRIRTEFESLVAMADRSLG